MRILLDECVTRKLKRHLPGFDVCTVVEMGWSGLKNGRLLMAAVSEKFDLLLTIDKNIGYQQNIHAFNIAIVVFDTMHSKIEFLLKFLPAFLTQIADFKPGTISILPEPFFDLEKDG